MITGIGEREIPQKVPAPSLKCSHPTWSPDGDKIAFVCFSSPNRKEESDIWIAEIRERAQIKNIAEVTEKKEIKEIKTYKLLEIPGVQKDPEWSPDGNSIAYSTGYWAASGRLVEELWIVDVENKTRISLEMPKKRDRPLFKGKNPLGEFRIESPGDCIPEPKFYIQLPDDTSTSSQKFCHF